MLGRDKGEQFTVDVDVCQYPEQTVDCPFLEDLAGGSSGGGQIAHVEVKNGKTNMYLEDEQNTLLETSTVRFRGAVTAQDVTEAFERCRCPDGETCGAVVILSQLAEQQAV